MNQQREQYRCECGKEFDTRNDLDKHRQNCATAQSTSGSSSGGRTRTAGGSSQTNE
jgi:uncharacterized membrane protein